jgi:hypothetical protein
MIIFTSICCEWVSAIGFTIVDRFSSPKSGSRHQAQYRPQTPQARKYDNEFRETRVTYVEIFGLDDVTSVEFVRVRTEPRYVSQIYA